MRNCLWVMSALIICSIVCFAQGDPKQVLGPKECKTCHTKEFHVWESTTHSTTYRNLHFHPKTRNLMRTLNLRGSVRRQNDCNRCHYLLKDYGRRVRPVAAVACESCHGPAQNWIKIHNELKTMSLEERHRRVDAVGMNRPGRIYHLAQNCYKCHIIDDEKLVNKGNHPRSKNFQLVTWSQGIIRHNFLRGKGKNVPASDARKRVFYVVGTALEVEQRLRSLAKATKKGVYFSNMAKKLKTATKKLVEINKIAAVSETKLMIYALHGIKIQLNQSDKLISAADKLQQATILFVKEHDGSQLAQLDALVAKYAK